MQPQHHLPGSCHAGKYRLRRLETNRWAITEKPAALMQVYTLYMDDLSRQRDQFAARVQAKARQYL
jgi:predicted metalloprotease with PDZ domain